MTKKTDRPILISITSGAIFKFILIVLLIWFIFVMKSLLLVVLTAVVVASAVEPAAHFFKRFKIPRVLSVLVIYIVTALILSWVIYLFVPILINDIKELTSVFPAHLQKIEQISLFGKSLPSFNEMFSYFNQQIPSATEIVPKITSTIFGGIFGFLLIIVLSFYLAVQKDGVEQFLRLIIPIEHEEYALDFWRRTKQKIGLWMQGQLLLGFLIGILTYLGLSILQVENALALSVLAGIFELIPVFGPTISAVPAVIIASLQGGFPLGIMVLLLYVIIQQFENQLIYPLVVKKIVGIPAIVSILALIVGGQLAGFLGMILSVPVSAAILEFLSDLEKEKFATRKREKES